MKTKKTKPISVHVNVMEPAHIRDLCAAIKARLVVQIRYQQQLTSRAFAPHVVYRTEENSVVVGGIQRENPQKPLERNVVRTFTVADISSIAVTKLRFNPDRRFAPHDAKYRGRVICSVHIL